MFNVEMCLIFQMKSSSLGRTGVSLSASGNRSMSSKDLLALAGPTHEYNKPRIQVATEKLHELFMALRESEVKENNEPYQPDAFLQALRFALELKKYFSLFLRMVVFYYLGFCFAGKLILFLKEISSRMRTNFWCVYWTTSEKPFNCW